MEQGVVEEDGGDVQAVGMPQWACVCRGCPPVLSLRVYTEARKLGDGVRQFDFMLAPALAGLFEVVVM